MLRCFSCMKHQCNRTKVHSLGQKKNIILSKNGGTIPIAEALLIKGAQLGTILAFMMAVTTLSLPSMIMLRKAVKPKLLGAFIAICAVGIIVVGYIFNFLQAYII